MKKLKEVSELFRKIKQEKWKKENIKTPEEKKRCSKCGREVCMPFYVERKRLFRSKTKKWCFSCYNKLKSGVGKLELTEVVITSAKDDSTLGGMFIGDNVMMPSISTRRFTVPEEDNGIPDFYAKLGYVREKWVDCSHINILKSINNCYACKHIDNKSKTCNDKDCPIKMRIIID